MLTYSMFHASLWRNEAPFRSFGLDRGLMEKGNV